MNQIFLMGLIANRGLRKKYLAFFEEHHITVVLSTMAAGTASNTILDALGLEATEKTVYFALLTRDTWKSLKKELYEKIDIGLKQIEEGKYTSAKQAFKELEEKYDL